MGGRRRVREVRLRFTKRNWQRAVEGLVRVGNAAERSSLCRCEPGFRFYCGYLTELSLFESLSIVCGRVLDRVHLFLCLGY